MVTGLEIVGGMLLLSGASMAAGAAVMARIFPSSPKPGKSKKAAMPVAVARERARAKRCMIPEKIALMVVEYLRNEGLNAYPLIPDDLDDEINRWCDAAGVERASTQHIRELIALLPGVARERIRPNTNHPKNRYVRNRLIARGRTIGEKATVYAISDGPIVRPDMLADTPCATPAARPKPGRTLSNPGPTHVRSGRTRDPKVRPDDHQVWPSDVPRRAAA